MESVKKVRTSVSLSLDRFCGRVPPTNTFLILGFFPLAGSVGIEPARLLCSPTDKPDLARLKRTKSPGLAQVALALSLSLCLSVCLSPLLFFVFPFPRCSPLLFISFARRFKIPQGTDGGSHDLVFPTGDPANHRLIAGLEVQFLTAAGECLRSDRAVVTELGSDVAGSDPEAVPEVRHPVRGHPRVSVQPEAHDLFGDGY